MRQNALSRLSFDTLNTKVHYMYIYTVRKRYLDIATYIDDDDNEILIW